MYESTSIYVPCQLGSLGFGKVGVFFQISNKKMEQSWSEQFPPHRFQSAHLSWTSWKCL